MSESCCRSPAQGYGQAQPPPEKAWYLKLEYIRLAAGGETVLVTDRDRVVAELGPPAPGRSPLVSDALLLEAVRQGWIRPPLSVASEMPARKPVMKLAEILQDLQDDRTDR